ncbi:FkbM family methyltransferase [Methylovulum psychrotolerans]|uniref:FkbM family methyltransferase n=1 Tax=Methylovulum psychrotolerans TaxID=1704499 RepID=UPI001BFF73FE|nr:FkbM family methyltransferase [Methylovulum psychrotolerans]MBT9099542.1 FkbM family methyltransferase [Methylovulum psychrotolerans]
MDKKALIRKVKNQFKQLQWGRWRILVAVVATIQQSIKYWSPIHIYIDSDGDWHNRRNLIELVSPELNVSSLDEIYASVIDLWCYRYKPQPGDVVVDIGAGIGDDVVIFSKLVGDNGLVIAIEAHPITYRCLLKTIQVNGLGNVVAINSAVSDNDGDVLISNEANYLSNTIQSCNSGTHIKAELFDSIAIKYNLKNIKLMKMNIEGAEIPAIRGMNDILNKIENIVVECHDFKCERGESEYYRTHTWVNEALRKAGFDLQGRPDDARSHVRFSLYGRNLAFS